jgi:enoyl-CoA hydratase/carnithine racemase
MSDTLVQRDGDFTTITMNRPRRRNALSREFLIDLTRAFQEVAESDVVGIILAANGPVFSAGHDFADVAGASHEGVRSLLLTCTDLMRTIQSVRQVVIASCDLAVAAESAGFAAPGGKGGWFCHTPMVPIAHNIGRKRAMEMALTGDVIDSRTAAEWGLINYAVPDAELEKATAELLRRATQGSPRSKALGKQALYAQLDRPEQDAYTYAIEVMAASSQTPEAQEGVHAFLEKRPPHWPA